MIQPANGFLFRAAGPVVLSLTASALFLIFLGRWLFPGESILGVKAASIAVLSSGMALWLGIRRIHGESTAIVKPTAIFGAVAGLAFAVEIIAEYILLPTDNSAMGVAEFGLVFCAWFALGLVVGRRQPRVWPAAMAGLGAALVASLIWLVVLLSVHYLFLGTAAQEQVLKAEGTFQDYAVHGGTGDFGTFVIEDLMGAAFFHLVLGSIAGLGLGSLGGLIMRGARGIQKRGQRG